MSGPRGARVLLVLAALGGCRRAPPPPPKTTSRWVSPLPQGNSLHAVWVAPSGDMLAAGDGGTLVRFNAAEQRWTVRELLDVVLVALRGTDDGRVFVGGQKGTLLVSRDGGATWSAVSSGIDGCIGAFSACGDDVYAVGSGGQFTRSRDRGATWRAGRVPGAPAPTTGSWLLNDAGDLTGVACEADGRVTAIAFGGAVLTSRDHGETWQRRDVSPADLHMVGRKASQAALQFRRLVRAGPDLLIMDALGVPARGERLPARRWTHVLRVREDGVEPWSVSMRPYRPVTEDLEWAPTSMHGFVVTPSGRAAEVGEQGMLHYAAPADRAWRDAAYDARTDEVPMQSEMMFDIAGDDRALYGVGPWGSMFRSSDAGQLWQRLRPPIDLFHQIWAEGDLATAIGHGVSDSRDGGRTWSTPRRMDGVNLAACHAIWGHGADRYLATSGLFHSSNGGATFDPVPLPLKGGFRGWGVWGDGSGSVIAVGGEHGQHGVALAGVILRRAATGFEVAVQIPAPTLTTGLPRVFTCLHGNRAGRVYAGGVQGIAYRSADGGATWTRLPPLAPEQDWKDVHAGDGDVVWALTEIAGRSLTSLWRSIDGGQHFTPVAPPRGPATISAIGGSPAGELVVAAEGRVFERDDTSGGWAELTAGAHAATSPLVTLAVPARRHVLAAGTMGAIIRVAPSDEP